MKKMRFFNCTQTMRFFVFLTLVLLTNTIVRGATKDEIDKVWKEYRAEHPYGFQAVGLKHLGDECVFIISEPSERVQEASLTNLFKEYRGTTDIKKHPFGYDGWLADYIGCVRFDSSEAFGQFTTKLFSILYGTDYKASFVNLDNPQKHTYFSHQNLNYSISAAEIEKWMLTDGELFINSTGQKKTVSQILSSDLPNSDELWHSSQRGFVVWSFDSKQYNNESFKQNARKFALDTDLIIGAIGRKGKNFVIIARERNISTEILPPLRTETIQLLATTDNKNLAQSYERYHVFAGKTHQQQDVAPIYLSDELWHTEYGNLLNLTDQMLKSWSENGTIDYSEFNHPKPIDWAFNNSALRDLETNELTFNWNTAGAGYVIQGDNDFDIYAVNRTGSLPVSYIPGGMEGKVDEKVNDAEELAYDFFSELNSPELVRVVQYSSLYQIFQYYIDNSLENELESAVRIGNTYYITSMPTTLSSMSMRKLVRNKNDVPDYSSLEPFVENILKIAESKDYTNDVIDSSLKRFYKKAQVNNPNTRLAEISSQEDAESIIAFLKENMGSQYVDSLLTQPITEENAEEEFYSYLNPNIEQVRNYINNYKKKYGDFPYPKAAHYIVNPRKLQLDIDDIIDKGSHLEKEYNIRVKAYNQRVDKYNASIRAKKIDWMEKYSLENEKQSIDELKKKLIKQRKEQDKEIENLSALTADNQLSKSIAALNWLLTDPKKYTEPFGDFFSNFFKSNHNKWIKSPSIACSFNGVGYGGHNLDAHVTPIKYATNLKAGKCRVSMVNGQRVVSVSKADRSRVTPAVLRQIERRVSGNQEISLPEAPVERAKSVIFEEMNTKCNERGFSSVFEVAEVSPSKTVQIKNINCGTLDELYSCIGDAVANNEPLPVREIRYKGMSAREVQVQVDNLRECVLERTIDNEAVLSDFDVNEIEAVVKDDGMVVITLPQKASSIPQNTYKAGMMEFQVPAGAEEIVKSVIKKVSAMPEEKINNHFKMMRQIRLELQKHPEINIQDVKDEYIRLFGFILLEHGNEYFTYTVA